MTIQIATLGYPRIGKNREVKKALEAFWSNKSDTDILLQTVQEAEFANCEFANWKIQLEAGIDCIGIGDTTLYDHVLDWTVRFGLIPNRFQSLTELDQYFAIARGRDGILAMEMTKWFDTNYHYIVQNIVQIDEPALREGLPLKPEHWNEYLSWAVDAFRLAAGVAKPETQIYTHMFYSEFGDIIQHIERLDADVLSIENSRSNNGTLFEIIDTGYQRQVGNGVYDVYSPVVSSIEQMVQQLKTGIANLVIEQI